MLAQRSVTFVICGASALLVLLSIVGGIVNFSAVPFWDMWDGALGFIQKYETDPAGAMFGQHNEHRIVLARLLFLLEYKVFSGSGLFLIGVNYLCILVICAIYWRCLQILNRDEAHRLHVLVAGAALSGWLCLWSQSSNLTWAFQSSFFLAQIFPLLACLALARADLDGPLLRRWFWISIILGIISAGTMANGLATLPLMVFGALLLRMGLLKTVILALVAVGAIGLYFHGYVSPAGHGSLVETLMSHPFGMLLFVCRYIGSPFFFIFRGNQIADLVAVLAGGGFIATAVLLSVQFLRGKKFHFVSAGLVLFIMYVGLTAFVTAGGRLFLGAENAFSSRYTTPALMGWAALFCIFSPCILARFRQANTERLASLSIVAAGILLLLKFQLTALSPAHDRVHTESVAALAAELNIADTPYISTIYPNTRVVLDIAASATEDDLAVFGLSPYRDLRADIGKPADVEPLRACRGNLDRFERIEGEEAYVRIYGWQFDSGQFDSENTDASSSVRVIDAQGVLVGFALLGVHRRDVADLVDKKAKRSGFTGYMQADALGGDLKLVGAACEITGNLGQD